mgnify:CR=1 FL=1
MLPAYRLGFHTYGFSCNAPAKFRVFSREHPAPRSATIGEAMESEGTDSAHTDYSRVLRSTVLTMISRSCRSLLAMVATTSASGLASVMRSLVLSVAANNVSSVGTESGIEQHDRYAGLSWRVQRFVPAVVVRAGHVDSRDDDDVGHALRHVLDTLLGVSCASTVPETGR